MLIPMARWQDRYISPAAQQSQSLQATDYAYKFKLPVPKYCCERPRPESITGNAEPGAAWPAKRRFGSRKLTMLIPQGLPFRVLAIWVINGLLTRASCAGAGRSWPRVSPRHPKQKSNWPHEAWQGNKHQRWVKINGPESPWAETPPPPSSLDMKSI